MRHGSQPEFAAQGVNLITAMLCNGDDKCQQSSGRNIVLDKPCSDGVHCGKTLQHGESFGAEQLLKVRHARLTLHSDTGKTAR